LFDVLSQDLDELFLCGSHLPPPRALVVGFPCSLPRYSYLVSLTVVRSLELSPHGSISFYGLESVLCVLYEIWLGRQYCKHSDVQVWPRKSDIRTPTRLPCAGRETLLLGRKMPQLARLWVESGIPEIKCRLLARKPAPKIRLGFRGYTPSTCSSIEGDRASCFSCFIGQVRNLRGHSRPPPRPQL